MNRSPAPLSPAALFLLAALAGRLTPAHAQPPADPHAIVLDVVVAPKSGPPVGGLTRDDLTLRDNGSVVPLTSFRQVHAAAAPIEVVLLLDAVNTTATNLAFERQQVEAFLRTNGGALAHPTQVVILTDTGVKLDPGFSTDGNALAAALDRQTIGLREIRPDTGIWGAEDRTQISLNALQHLAAWEAQQPGRKIVLWISPGWPYLSGPAIELSAKQQQQVYSTVTAISTALRRDGITLYSVDSLGARQAVGWEFDYLRFVKGIRKPSQAELGDLSLQALAVQSGGLATSASNDLAAELRRCLEDLSEFYEIAFIPPPAERPGEYHELEIAVDRPGLRARTRAGYYSGEAPEPTAPRAR